MQECDLGQQSILHAVKARSRPTVKRPPNLEANPSIEEDNNELSEEHGASKPLSQTLNELRLDNVDKILDNGTFQLISSKKAKDIQLNFHFQTGEK